MVYGDLLIFIKAPGNRGDEHVSIFAIIVCAPDIAIPAGAYINRTLPPAPRVFFPHGRCLYCEYSGIGHVFPSGWSNRSIGYE